MTEKEKNEQEKTDLQKPQSQKTEDNTHKPTDPSSAQPSAGKASIEPRTARGASTTAHRKTAREAEAALDEKIAKARAGAAPASAEPTPESPAPFTKAKGEASGLAPVTTVRAMLELARKEKNGKQEAAKTKAQTNSKTNAQIKTDSKPGDASKAKPEKKPKDTKPQETKQQSTKQQSAPKKDAKPAGASGQAGKSVQATQKPAQKEKASEKNSGQTTAKASKPVQKSQATPPKMPARDATGRFLPSGKKKVKGTAGKNDEKAKDLKSEVKAQTKPAAAPADEKAKESATPVLSMLMNEAPSGVSAELKADDRPARGEIKGSPKKDEAEVATAPIGNEVSSATKPAAGIVSLSAVDDEDDDEEDYDAVPDPTVTLSETLDDDDDEIAIADEDEVEDEESSSASDFHPTETLSGRRTPVRTKTGSTKPVPQDDDPSRSVDLETERIDAEHAAQQALLRLKARSQPARAELASKLASRSIAEMERGNPAFSKEGETANDNARSQAEQGKTASGNRPAPVDGISPDPRTQGWNALWQNGVKAAQAEQEAMVDVRRPPQYGFDDEKTDQVERDAAYARRMDDWEKTVLAEGESRNQRVSCRGPKPGPRVPVRTQTHETLGGFPTPHATRTWTGPGINASEKPSLRDALRMKLNRLHERWSGLEACLRVAIGIAFVTAVAAAASWTTAKALVPRLALRHAPLSVTAVVADDEIRNLMLLTAMLDARGMPTGRTAPLVDRVYLTGDLRKALTTDDEASRMTLPLDDALLRAAVMEASDMAGAPVLSRKAVLAMPDAAHSTTGRTIDVTDLVVERLGLKNVSAAAAKEALTGLMSPAGIQSLPSEAPKAAAEPKAKPVASR